VDDIESNEDFELIRRLTRKLGEAGYLALDMEGFGRDKPSLTLSALASEEVAGRNYALGATASVIKIVGKTLKDFGGPPLRERFLAPLCRGEALGAFCITEPQAGSDTSRMETRITADGGSWVVNGRKKFITNAGVADLYLVWGVSDPDAPPSRRLSCVAIEKDAPGLTLEKRLRHMGRRGFMNGVLRFENVRVPKGHLVGPLHSGRGVLGAHFAAERVYLAASYLGVAKAAYRAAKDYARQRVQFGKPIASKQAIYHKIADMATSIDAAELMTYRAAKMLDRGADPGRMMREAAMAKYFASLMVNEVCDEAVQILGGEGYCKEHHRVERYYRDARIARIGGGTDEMQKYIIAGREMPDLKLDL
jgi:alkylation response protein AidB-like acyl-CoA dehydrogenase